MLYNGDNSYLFVNRNEIFKFKFSNRNVNSNKNVTNQFYLESIVNKFSYVKAEEVSLKKKCVWFLIWLWSNHENGHIKYSQVFDEQEWYSINKMFRFIKKMLIAA